MRKLFTVTKIVLLTVCAVSLIGASSANAQKKWYFGIGSGFTLMNTKGDQGLNTVLSGPIESEIDMQPSDFNDFTESAFGFGGYATDGMWMITYSYVKLKLGDDPEEDLPGGGTFTSEFFFETTAGEFTVGYVAMRSKNMKVSFTPYAGVRYIKHELVANLIVTQGPSTIQIMEEIDNNWTDLLLGTSFGIVVSRGVTWSIQADAGFGGSEGTYTFKTGLSWKPTKSLSLGPNFKYSAIEYENGEKGDSDWYFYDANEFGAGITALYNF